MSRKTYLLAFVLLGCLWLGSGMRVAAAGPSTDSWIVHAPADTRTMPRGPNRLGNAGFESGATWTYYGTRYVVDTTVAHSGAASARLGSSTLGAAIQQVTLNQPSPKPIYISGWSKASGVSGSCRMQYALYLDISYTDGTTALSQYLCFSTGTHDWEYVERVIFPQKPVASIWMWTMFQSGGAGVAWFDDLAVGEYIGEIRQFDDAQILYQPPSDRPWEGAQVLSLDSGDGLSLGLTASGGAIASLQVNGQEQLDAAHIYAGGFYVRDVASNSAYIHLGGMVARASNGDLVYNGRDTSLGLVITATLHAAGTHILMDASVQDTTGADRAISLYFALPLAPEERTWWQDIRNGYGAGTAPEQRYTLTTDWGANGQMSHYCLSDLSGQTGLTLAYPMDRPVVSRLVYNSQTHQDYVACELGLTPLSRPNPGRADVRLLLYYHDPAWGFRAAFAKYVQIYPEFFTQRVPDGGSWVLHHDLNAVPNIADFHIKFHSTGNSGVYPYDDSKNIYTLRYLCEPWGRWVGLPSNVSNLDYNAVMGYVQTMVASAIPSERNWGNAIMSSGIFDSAGRYIFEPAEYAFSGHAAAFLLNADPDVNVPGYWPNRGQQGWATSTKEAYAHPEWGILDGELIDSFEDRGLSSDFRSEHFAASNLPLTFDKTSQRVVLPHVFASYEFSKWVADDVHALGKYMMANGALLRWVFEGHLFDVMGSERGWISNGQFVPEGDMLLNLWRTFAYRKPYCVAQNCDLTAFTHATVEQYFGVCAFYGIYPSFFTYDVGVTNYWSRPEWYERDRDLFIKYMPKIEALNQAGWEPLTYAVTRDARVYIERYGSGSMFYLTLRNMVNTDITPTVTVDLAALGLPLAGDYSVDEWLTASPVAASVAGNKLLLTPRVPALSTRILRVQVRNTQRYTLGLSTGWNLVALPGVPLSSYRIADTLASIQGQFDRVYAYDAPSQQWRSYDARLPYGQRLSEVQPGQGFWVRTLAPVSWEITCVQQISMTLPLQAGWNLVSYSLNMPQTVTQAVAPLGARLQAIYGYDTSDAASPWRSYLADVPPAQNTLSLLVPGKGYWVQVNQACSWTLAVIP